MKYLLATLMIMTSVLFGVRINQENTSKNSDEIIPPSSRPSAVKFVLKYTDGNISLFEGESIIETFSEINYSVLPYPDQQSLSDGIEFDNINEAYELIEDFDG